MNIVIILPTYNERENIESLISSIEGLFEKRVKYKLHILVVDDYSPDGTGDVVKKLAKKYKNITLISKKKEGLGAAYVYAMTYALKNLDPDTFLQMDADWSHNPLLLPEMLAKLDKGADLVIGSRYIEGGSIPGNWGIQRKIYSVIGNLIVRFGLGMLHPHDWSSGYRLMRVEVFKKVSAGLEKYTGYTFQIAFLHRAKMAHFKIEEVPLQFIDRVHGKSKFASFDYIKNVLLYIFNNSTLIKYLIIGVGGFTVQTLVSKLLISFGIFPGLAVTIGAFCAIVTNFLGNNLWTFSHKKIEGMKLLIRKFIHFMLTSIGAVIIQGVVVGVGVYFFGNEAWFWLMIIAIIFFVIPYNYFVYNRFIWKTR